MAFMSLTGWAADLVGSQFTISNVTYSEAVAPGLVDDGTYGATDYSIDLATWYTDEACTTVAKDGDGNPYTISTLPVGKYWVKITGMGTYEALTTSASFNVLAIAATISFTAGQTKEWNTDEPDSYTYTLTKKGVAWTDADAATKLGLTVGRVAGTAVAEYDYTFDWTNKNYSLTRSDANKFEITAKNIGGTATITAVKTTMVYTGKNATGIYTVKDGERLWWKVLTGIWLLRKTLVQTISRPLLSKATTLVRRTRQLPLPSLKPPSLSASMISR